jgi:hypothetical protein
MKDGRALHISKKKANVMKEEESNPLVLRAQTRELIEENWKVLLERRPDLFNAQLLRFIKASTTDIFYKDVVGLRYSKGFEPRIIDKEDVFQSLSCYIFVKTSDGKLIFTGRDSGDWSIALDLPGGFIQAKHNITDMAEFARSRTMSDLLIDNTCIKDAVCIGSFDFKEILEYMAVYQVNLTISFEELKSISKIEVFEIPMDYSASRHSEFFDTRLHFAAAPILDSFLDSART